MNWAREALKYIKKMGWTQGDFKTDEGICLLGACALALTDGKEADFDYLHDSQEVAWVTLRECRLMLEDCIEELTSSKLVVHPTTWNDGPDRTEEEVVEVLKCAARKIDRIQKSS